jgi:agmatine deiminase
MNQVCTDTVAASPARLGYRHPAEWEPHAATWLAWPHNRATWPGTFENIPPIFAQLVERISRYEPVKLLAGTGDVWAQARQMVGHLPNVQFWPIETNDAWCRDHGPMFLEGLDLPPALVDWQYNAWGEKYPPFDKDNAVPARIAALGNYRRFPAELVLEGGAVDFNGRGTLLTTRSCLLHPRRNPGRTEEEVTAYLRDFACVRHVVWLSGGDFQGDDTDGHIDQLARFVGPRTIVVATCGNPSDPNFPVLRRLAEELQGAVDQDGARFEIVALPIPEPKFFQGRRLPASYCNFYCLNGAVLVPAFDDPADTRAAAILGDLFPDRRVELFPCIDLIWGLGAVHCLTQQEPRWQ